jgi:hypothetical protein
LFQTDNTEGVLVPKFIINDKITSEKRRLEGGNAGWANQYTRIGAKKE